MSLLFSGTQLGELSLENRIVIAPMCQYSAEEGQATAGTAFISASWRSPARDC